MPYSYLLKRKIAAIFSLLMLFWISPGFSQAMDEYGIGKAFAARYQIDSAYAHMQKALKYSSKSSEGAKALISLQYGKLLKLKEKTDSSFIYFNKALETYKKQGNRDSILFVTASIAEVFRFRDNKYKALQYIQEAEQLLTLQTAPNIMAYYYNRRAGIENQFASDEYARQLSEKVIAMQDRVSDKETVAYSYNELGALYETADPKKSGAYYGAALELADMHGLLIPKASVLINLSRAAPTIDLRIQRLEEAYILSMQTDNLDMQFKISNLLFWPYKEKGDYKKAFEYCYRALYLEDKMYDSRALARTAEIERKYNLSKAQDELRLKNTEVSNARKILVLTIIIAALALVVLLVVANFYRKTAKNNAVLEQLYKENEFLLGEANHRINNNLQLITIMISDELRKQDVERQDSLNKIMSKVGSIALLHRHLYKADDKRIVNVGEYLREVLANFSDVFTEQGILTSFTIENIHISNEEAIYMGLLATELCINTLKHAFTGQEDKLICFELAVHNDKILFRFSDNGKAAAGTGIEPKLALRLCRQLKVECTIGTDNGFMLYFEK
ncbi:sensor histidine kinase [uncultured Flavobacterium sp.]|uniref:sensor histidine kinase n=1 Tax=uncultured Flavobacterium sp. TaxID=165435 RepID=UPI0025CFC696|nr:sensor histidine kinase [uncultured Flavobacterium sp.]